MGRVTVSLSDELEGRLDAYAEKHQLPVSHVVAQALEAFLDMAPRPPAGSADREARAYVEELSRHVAEIRGFLEETAGWISGPLNPVKERVPKPLPPPRWDRPPEPRSRIHRVLKQIRRILWEDWDPIGIRDVSSARDEYDSYAPQLLRMIQEGRTALEFAEHLRALETDRMGLGQRPSESLLPVGLQLEALRADLAPPGDV